MDKFLRLWKKYSFTLLIGFAISGMFDLRLAVVAIICMVAPVLVSFIKGRFWCGNLCPRGNFYDNIVSRFSKNRKVPEFLKSKFFRIAVIVFMFTMFGLGVKQNWGNLYGIGMVFYRIIMITTLIGIVLSLFYNHRTWCHFCPMGSISALISSLRKDKKILEVASSCVSCKICHRKCPMGISPYEYKGDVLSHPDCIQCAQCAIACPKKAIGYDTVSERKIVNDIKTAK